MSKVRWLVALWIAKLIRRIIKIFNFSGGTALPGLIALKIDANFVIQAAKKLDYSIIITGTNGKTTTSRMISEILSKDSIKVLHNRAGSNLKRGIASTITEKAGFFGKLPQAVGLWEVDEAVMPELVLEIQPKILIVLNLFRDQLDRYGEVETIRKKWQKGVENLSQDSTLVLNALDPSVASLEKNAKAKVISFGLSDLNQLQTQVARAADQIFCPMCLQKLDYEKVYLSHAGIYQCIKCGFKTPVLDFWAENISFSAMSSHFTIKRQSLEKNINLQIGGLYNILNAVAAFSVGKILNIDSDKIKEALNGFEAAFGRMEKIKVGNNFIYFYLIKNPTGANEVIRTLFKDPESKNVLLALNDKIADGTDVSWIWDVEFEKLVGKTEKLIITGIRAYDLALRLKYAGLDKPNLITTDFKKAIKETFVLKKDFYYLPTYTAMLDLRSKLTKTLGKKQFWEE